MEVRTEILFLRKLTLASRVVHKPHVKDLSAGQPSGTAMTNKLGCCTRDYTEPTP